MEQLVNKYVDLIVKKGINIQKGQPVFINASVENHEFVTKISKKLYEYGASDVCVNWSSTDMGRLAYEYKTTESLKDVPGWSVERYKMYVEKGAAFLSIASNDPEALKGLDVNKISEHSKAVMKAMEPYRASIMNDENTWCVIAIPSVKWAEKVFPNAKDPVTDLWNAILHAAKCNFDNPVEEWTKHVEKLQAMAKKLNESKFDYLHFSNEKGTDLKVGLVNKHIWASGESINKLTNVTFNANIPTEEVFTMPDKYNVNGRVVASKALNYNGNLIDGFWIEFKDGKAVDWDAKVNKEVLTKMIESDENSCYLGEVALVEDDNPISQMDILFYNTLFDENASCHLALGKAYPTNIDMDLSKCSKEELSNLGVNESLIHVDFMFGDETMSVYGYKGEKKQELMKNGKFIVE